MIQRPLSLFVVGLALLTPSISFGQSKVRIGIIDVDRAISTHPDTQRTKQEIEQIRRSWLKRIEELKAQAKLWKEQLPKLKGPEREKVANKLNRSVYDLFDLRRYADDSVRKALDKRRADMVRDICQRAAKEGHKAGLTLVIRASGHTRKEEILRQANILYANHDDIEIIDLTPQIIRKLQAEAEKRRPGPY